MRICLLFVLFVSVLEGEAQQTVFALLQKKTKLADKYYSEYNFQEALRLYNQAAQGRHSSKQLQLRIAQCHYSLKEYRKAIEAYDTYQNENELPMLDLYYYAEAQAALSNYEKAASCYRKYLLKDPSNDVVTKKIWRIDNKQYLYEDSAHYALRPVLLNTTYGELCPTPFRNGVVFMSNRKGVSPVQKINVSTNTPFYGIYFSKIIQDSSFSPTAPLQFEETTSFDRDFDSRFNTGPVAFYANEKKMAFISSAAKTAEDGKRTLGLYFAEIKNEKWVVTSSFDHNSDHYSINDVTISESGKTIFFSSDMKGGYGGLDLYKSEFIGSKWSKPFNLGDVINSAKDEAFPFFHRSQTLYFSSNGLPGLGEYDVFKAMAKSDGFEEPQNVGYPVNSNRDDFGFVLDTSSTHGYISSNRKAGGYDDDLYEFDMDLQPYPLTITGVIKFKEHAWSAGTELKVLPRGKIFLIDNLRNVNVYEGRSDNNGKFSIVIPYFSKYFIRVVGEEGDEHKVSLEILKYKKELSDYEIVIIKDHFTNEVVEKK